MAVKESAETLVKVGAGGIWENFSYALVVAAVTSGPMTALWKLIGEHWPVAVSAGLAVGVPVSVLITALRKNRVHQAFSKNNNHLDQAAQPKTSSPMKTSSTNDFPGVTDFRVFADPAAAAAAAEMTRAQLESVRERLWVFAPIGFDFLSNYRSHFVSCIERQVDVRILLGNPDGEGIAVFAKATGRELDELRKDIGKSNDILSEIRSGIQSVDHKRFFQVRYTDRCPLHSSWLTETTANVKVHLGIGLNRGPVMRGSDAKIRKNLSDAFQTLWDGADRQPESRQTKPQSPHTQVAQRARIKIYITTTDLRGLTTTDPFIRISGIVENYCAPITLDRAEGHITVNGQRCNQPLRLEGSVVMPLDSRDSWSIHQTVTAEMAKMIRSALSTKTGSMECDLSQMRLGGLSDESYYSNLLFTVRGPMDFKSGPAESLMAQRRGGVTLTP